MIITKRQKELLDFIGPFIEEKGYAPSIGEIQKQFDINSPATVHQHLKNLEEKKLIRRIPNRHRSIELIAEKNATKQREVPVLGAIAAGDPIESFPAGDTMMLPEEMVGDYLLMVRGDSMIDDHILDGDLVIIKRKEIATSGQTVVALIENREATLKRYYPENGRIRLQPANTDMAPMIYDAHQVQVQGIVVGIVRKFG